VSTLRNTGDPRQNPKHGDYQCTAAMPIYAALKSTSVKLAAAGIQSPQDVAKVLIAAIKFLNHASTDMSVNGPGFVMCRVHTNFSNIT
jgi:arginyl-tRNA synthetase